MNTKQKDPAEIIKQIQTLLGELANLLGHEIHIIDSRRAITEKGEKFSGPSGGAKLLLKEGFFSQPKTLPAVVTRLHQDGFTYTTQAIATALLRLVRSRAMVRIPAAGGGKEQWAYAERK